MCWSFWSNAQGEVEGLWRAPCQLKEPLKGLRPIQGCCLKNQNRAISTPLNIKEFTDLPSKQINDFQHKANIKIELLVTRPVPIGFYHDVSSVGEFDVLGTVAWNLLDRTVGKRDLHHSARISHLLLTTEMFQSIKFLKIDLEWKRHQTLPSNEKWPTSNATITYAMHSHVSMIDSTNNCGNDCIKDTKFSTRIYNCNNKKLKAQRCCKFIPWLTENVGYRRGIID